MDFISLEAENGRQLFNQGDYFEAHEHFEDAWRQTSDPSREFYRALIHVSGGFYRLTQGRPDAARKFFTHALRWLREFPSQFLGIDTDELNKRLHELIKAIDQEQDSRIILQQQTLHIPLKIKDSRS